MMEDWFETNAKIVEKNATEEAKRTYWEQHMRKEEAKHLAEKQQRMRTDNLKQSDFLKNLVATKEVIEKQTTSAVTINWPKTTVQSPRWLKRLNTNINTAVGNLQNHNNHHPLWAIPNLAVGEKTTSTSGINNSRPNIIESLDSDNDDEG